MHVSMLKMISHVSRNQMEDLVPLITFLKNVITIIKIVKRCDNCRMMRSEIIKVVFNYAGKMCNGCKMFNL